MPDSSLGRMTWYELLTTDVEAAKRFYTAVVGWTTAPFAESPEPYDMWMRADGNPTGGVMAIPQGMNFPPHWGMYVDVPNLDEAVARIERLGGRTLSPAIALPSVGRIQTMADPQGATFSIHQPVSAPPASEGEPPVGAVSWHELYTTDADAALKFYTELFGWIPTGSMDMGEAGQYHMFGRTEPMGGMMNKPSAMAQVPPHWGLYFRVPDVNEGVERVRANGGQVLNGPMEVPGGDWIINCMDPQGAAFSLHHKK